MHNLVCFLRKLLRGNQDVCARVVHDIPEFDDREPGRQGDSNPIRSEDTQQRYYIVLSGVSIIIHD